MTPEETFPRAQSDRNPRHVLILEPDTILRAGVRVMVDAHDKFEVVGEAGCAAEALPLIDQRQPDIVITAMPLPDRLGTELISQLHEARPTLAILVLTTLATTDWAGAAMRAGAVGYVSKDCGREELMTAITEVAAGRKYLCKSLKRPSRRMPREAFRRAKFAAASLTPQQWRILRVLALGYRNREIAQTLGVSLKVVEYQRDRLRDVLGLHNTAHLTMYAVCQGLKENACTTGRADSGSPHRDLI